MKNLILSIDGMTCSACSNGLEKYLNKQNGIFNASVNLVMANATVTYDEKILNQEIIEKYVKQAGFKSLGVFKELNLEKNNKKRKTEIYYFYNSSNYFNVYCNGTHDKFTYYKLFRPTSQSYKLHVKSTNINNYIFNIWI